MLSALCFYLASGGYEVSVVTSRQRYDDPAARLPVRERVAGVEVYRVRTSEFGRVRLAGRAIDYVSFYLAAAARIARLARGMDVVVAKTDPPLLGVVVRAAAVGSGTAVVNWNQDLFPEAAEALGIPAVKGAVAGALRWLRDTVARQARFNVVLGERMAARMRAAGVPEDRIRIIPNWADGQALRPVAPERNELREEWGLSGKFVVGYSGNLGRAHEARTMLDAVRLLRSERDIVFVWIGGGVEYEKLRRRVEAEGLDNCLFMPYQPESVLAQSLGVADVHLVSLRPELEGLIVPSKFYGISAVGRPIIFIGDPDGELASIIKRHECGHVVQAGDGESLAHIIRRLRDRPEERGRLGANARALFEREYDAPLAFARWDRLLEDACAGGAA